MVSHLPNSKELKTLQKYNKNNVIELTESDSDENIESDRPSIEESSKEILDTNQINFAP